jgi:iron complex outermembrane receptor protein
VGPNSAGTLSIRGLSGSPNTRILVLIDGQPQYMGIFGHPISDAYVNDMVERVEVLRGGASLLYGSQAMAGAINLISREVEEGLFGDVRMSFGSFGTVRGNAHGSFRTGKLSVFASAGQERTDGIRTDARDDYVGNNGFLKLGYELNEQWRIQLDGNLTGADYFFPGPDTLPMEGDMGLREYIRNRVSLSVENGHQNWQGAFRFFRSGGKHDFADGFHSTDLVQGLSVYQSFTGWKAAQLTLGLDGQQFGGEATHDVLPPQLAVGFDQVYRLNEWAGYVLGKRQVFDQLNLQAGLRLTRHALYGSYALPSVGASWLISENTVVRAQANRSYRSPTVRDLYLFIPANDALLPETSWTYEAGFSQQLLQQRLSLELTAYWIEGQNLIQDVFLPPSPPQRQNVATFTHRGLEAQMTYQIDSHWQAGLSYAFLDMDKPRLFAPRHDLKAHGSFTRGRFQAGAQVRQLSGLVQDLNPVRESAYFLLDAQAEVRLFSWCRLFVVGKNLLNTDYVMERGYPMPGISVEGGIRLTGKRTRSKG